MRVCTLASGSSGNSAFIEGGGSAVLVDAGLSGKAITSSLEAIGVDGSQLDGILVTHEHIDHIKGVGVLSRKFNLKIYATESTWNEIVSVVGKVPDYNQVVIEAGRGFEIGGLQVEPFETSHDAVDSLGFSFFCEDVKVGIATDTGYLTNSARHSLDGADLLIFEANHDLNMLKTGHYPWHLKQRILSDKGHLSNVAAGHCLASLAGGNTKGVILSHLSRDNNLPELAYSTVAAVLEEFGIAEGDLKLEVAPRCHPGTLWDLNKEG